MSEVDVLPRVIVAGSRTIQDYAVFRHYILAYLNDTFHGEPVMIVTGRAINGPDDMAYHFARWDVGLPYIEFKADWDGPAGKGAGYARNSDMAKYASAKDDMGHLFCMWDGVSNGSKHMMKESKRVGLDCKIVIVDPMDFEDRYEIFNF